MAKREFIDKTHLLAEIKKLQKSLWYNCGENDMVVDMVVARAFYNERREAVEVVRDLCVNDEPVITEQEIVKPYLEKIKKLLKETYLEVSNIDLDTKTIGDTQSLSCSKFRNSMISKIDNLLIK